jgi:hypothetical protein
MLMQRPETAARAGSTTTTTTTSSSDDGSTATAAATYIDSEGAEGRVARELLRWFKYDFFKWVNK